MEYRERVLAAIGFIVFMLVFGTFIFVRLEQWTWVDALYFSAATLTTVGYGDIVPHTIPGRLFNVLYMLVGVATALYAFTIVAEHYFETHLPQATQSVKTRIKSLADERKQRRNEYYRGIVGDGKAAKGQQTAGRTKK